MNNKAIFDNKALNQIKKLVGGGGMVLVDTLPEIGKEDTLYKTPDGKIWSCTNTTETETICDLEVGKSFKLKEQILASEIVGLCDTLGEGQHPLEIISRKSGIVTIKISPEDTGPVTYGFVYSETNDVSESAVLYNATNVPLTDLVTGELQGFTEIPSVGITELLVENLTNANLELLDIAFAFINGSHTETITTSTWTEVSVANNTVKIGVNTFGSLSVLDFQVKINNDIYNVTSFDSNHGYITVPLDIIMSPVSVTILGSNHDIEWNTNFPDEPYYINYEYELPGEGIFSISIYETEPPA